MTKIKYSLTLLLLISTLSSFSQTLIDIAKKGSEQGTKVPTDSPAAYAAAVLLADKAIEKLNSGDSKEADRLIQKSINTYPTVSVFGYCNALAKLSDIVGANLIADKVINKVKTLGTPIYMFYKQVISASVQDGIVTKSIPHEIANERALFFIFLEETYKMNKVFGEQSRIIKSLQALNAVNLTPLVDANGIDQGYESKMGYAIDEATRSGNYEKALALIAIKKGKYYDKDSRTSFIMNVHEDAEDFVKLIEISKKYGNKLLKAEGLFKGYALMGNDQLAMLNYEKMMDFQKEENTSFFYLALVSILKKEYQTAITQLDQCVTLRAKAITDYRIAIDKWKIDKAYGDAYAGLKEYEKAKNYYNISLLTNPSYKPAIKALENLGLQYQQEVVADKIAPTIIITEPAPNRGLEIISAGNDILVKGTAVDPSGLKSVTINGQAVYVQLDGNFWGNVALKVGTNKIIVIATDGAGNTSEHTFEIEKKMAVAKSDIVPATTKEGKNYCLLIGAQNYEDLNIPSLENPIQDAVKLKLILKKDYDFEDGNVFNLFNPSANDVKRQLLELTNVIQPEDNLLIFYAGHGIWVEKEKKGYWLLVDAKRNDSNTWLQNKDVLNLIAKLPSRHTLLITDACFSGGVFKTRSIGKNAPAALKTMNEKISRVAITSGNDTEVPDESVFMKYLVKALTDNKEKYLTAQKMFINQIMEAVMTETKTEPRYGTLELAGHVGGDYIFAKK